MAVAAPCVRSAPTILLSNACGIVGELPALAFSATIHSHNEG